MALFGRNKAQVQELKARAETAEKLAVALEGRLADKKHVEELLVDNILTLQQINAKYVGNEYRDYEVAVRSISEKYNGVSDWGCLQTGTVVDLRAAFILGEGLKLNKTTETKEESKMELAWANDFLAYNGLDAEMAQEIAKEAEIEGKIALRLFWDEGPYGKDPEGKPWPGMLSVRYMSWLSKKYRVEADPEDYMWYKRLTWNASGVSPAGNVPEEEFVYKKFGGRSNDPNDAQPKVMKCLTQIDRLDKALRDLREINHLFASPTPDFKVDTAQQATLLLQFIADTNWRIGKAIVHVGEFSLKSPDSTGIQNLISEIELTTKLISGTTGIPIHYLGLLDLLKNRATGDNTRELVMAATTRERSIWIGVFEELLEKAMLMYNKRTGAEQKTTKLDPTKIGVDIPLISQDHWTNIEKVLIPAALGGIISKEYVAGTIPGVDLEEEAQHKLENEEKEMEQAQMELERLRTEMTMKKGGGEAAS